MDDKSEVVLRQESFLTKKLLLVNAPQDYLTQELEQRLSAEVTHWTWNFADYQFFLQTETNATFSIFPPQDTFDQVIIFIPKAKEQLNYVLDQCVGLLGVAKDIFLVGEKKAGIERAAKQLQPYGKTLKLDSARHCQMWQLKIDLEINSRPLKSWIKTYTIQVADLNLDICALPGVFSQDHLDVGTQQLLPFLSEVRSGEILDFGCGAGVISAVLAKQNEKRQILAVDIDAFALKSTELTFEKNGLSSQLKVQAITDIQEIKHLFHAIVSNPPFHQGIKTNYQASENLCRYAISHLKIRGELWIVANRFLNYAPLIEQQFHQCDVKVDQSGFKVLFAKK